MCEKFEPLNDNQRLRDTNAKKLNYAKLSPSPSRARARISSSTRTRFRAKLFIGPILLQFFAFPKF